MLDLLSNKKLHLAVLGSTRGTHLLTLIHAIEQQKLSATIEVVISNKSDALILERAVQHQIPAFFIDLSELSREQYDEQISKKLTSYPIDLIVLVGYMRLLSPVFIAQWKNKIINVHPSLLPDFAGSMNHQVYRAVLDSGIRETGCTVHWVTEEVDAGPHLLQKRCPVLYDDTTKSLQERVQQLEAQALIEVLADFASYLKMRVETF